MSAAATVLVLLIGFAIGQAIELRRFRLERNRANRERDRANRITDFMIGMFKVSDPSEARGNSVTAREIQDKASDDINSGLTMDVELRARMMQVMANVYDNLGLFPRAVSLNQGELEIRQRVLGPDHPDTLSSMNNLELILMGERRYAEAEKLTRETIEAEKRVIGPEDPDTLSSTSNLAIVLWRELHYPEAESLNRKTLDCRRRVLGPEHPETLKSMSNLALVLSNEGQYAEAEKLDRERTGVEKRILGPDHPAHSARWAAWLLFCREKAAMRKQKS